VQALLEVFTAGQRSAASVPVCALRRNRQGDIMMLPRDRSGRPLSMDQAVRKGLMRLGLIIGMAIAEILVIARFGLSNWIWPVAGAMLLFFVLNRSFDF
jgi:hypothetical protein